MNIPFDYAGTPTAAPARAAAAAATTTTTDAVRKCILRKLNKAERDAKRWGWGEDAKISPSPAESVRPELPHTSDRCQTLVLTTICLACQHFFFFSRPNDFLTKQMGQDSVTHSPSASSCLNPSFFFFFKSKKDTFCHPISATFTPSLVPLPPVGKSSPVFFYPSK